MNETFTQVLSFYEGIGSKTNTKSDECSRLFAQ